jgi:catechol 2,3-dioxygenase-like lactoylglutathione lyase family enzyme
MTISFDHHILPSTDRERSARFLTEVLGLPPAREEGPFLAVDLGNDVALYVAGWDSEVRPQHYAFLMSEEDLDGVLARLEASGSDWWADPEGTQLRRVNHDDGGRGCYFRGPDGHWLEALTVRYGGRPTTVGASRGGTD